MKTEKHIFNCPLCQQPDGTIIRGSQDHLKMATANHIMLHEQRAALIAVDAARLSCPEQNCAIGRKTHWNKTLGVTELTLTDFDKSLLAGMKISTD